MRVVMSRTGAVMSRAFAAACRVGSPKGETSEGKATGTLAAQGDEADLNNWPEGKTSRGLGEECL